MSRDTKTALRRVSADIRETLRQAAAAVDAGDWQQAEQFYLEASALASSAAESAERNAEKAGA